MAMVKFGDYYINPRHVSCVGMTEESTSGSEAKVYEVLVICQGQKMTKSFEKKSEARKLVEHIAINAS